MRKGVSEVVSIIMLIVIVMVSATSFFYWFSSGQDEAQIQTEMYQTNVFDQINSRTSSLIASRYSTNREININNFAEYVTQLCADERSIPMAKEDIRLEIYEGYGAGTELICAIRGFPGGCKTNETIIVGALGGSDNTNGIYVVSSTDGTAWTTSLVSSQYDEYTDFNFTHLSGFIEGNDNSLNPENILMLGAGKLSTTNQRKAVLVILDRTLTGKSYDITDLDADKTVYYDAEVIQELQGGVYNLFRGGAIIDRFSGEPIQAILTKNFAVYDVPQWLVGFGTNGRTIHTSKVTAIQGIIRNDFNPEPARLLVGVTGYAGAISYIDETQELDVGMEVNYLSPAVQCPYHIPSFAECGVTVDPMVCDITIGGVPDMLYVPDFPPSLKISDSAPIFIGVNSLRKDDYSTSPAVFFTGYTEDSSNIHCLDLSQIVIDPAYEIVELKYHQNSEQVLVFLKDTRSGNFEFQVIGIHKDYVPTAMNLPAVVNMRVETFDMVGDYIYVGGTNNTHAQIVRLGINPVSQGVTSESLVYNDTTYPSVQKLFSYTACTERFPTCISGCEKTLKKSDCTFLNLSIEDSSCDISKYSPGTKFTVKLGIGRYFEKLEIFTKRTGISSEINATEVG